MEAAGWSKESTFRKFYDKPITKNVNYGEHVVSLNTQTKQ